MKRTYHYQVGAAPPQLPLPSAKGFVRGVKLERDAMQSVEDKESCRCVCSIGLFPVSCGSLEGHTPRDDVICELCTSDVVSVIGFCRFDWRWEQNKYIYIV